jgi:lipoprotein-anchoring transpeptidase ErfK/SrfK
MNYSKGEVTGMIAASLVIAAIGVGMNYADQAGPAPDGDEPLAAAAAPTTPAQQPGDTPPPPGQGLIIRHILPIKDPIPYGKWYWNESGAPDGPVVVTVDLDARVLSVFRGGYEIATTAVLVGTEEKPTPLGVFPITQKDAHHVSNLYDAPMPYMQRLTNDGITLHATRVANGFASHGCIGMPPEFAKRLFATTRVGDKVYVTRGKQVGLGADLATS